MLALTVQDMSQLLAHGYRKKLPLWAGYFTVVLYKVCFPLHHLHTAVRAQPSETRCVRTKTGRVFQPHQWGYLVELYEVKPELSLYVIFCPRDFKVLWMHWRAPGVCRWKQSSGSRPCQGDQAPSRTRALPCRWRSLALICVSQTHTLRKSLLEIKISMVPISHPPEPKPGSLIPSYSKAQLFPWRSISSSITFLKLSECISLVVRHILGPPLGQIFLGLEILTHQYFYLSPFQTYKSCSCKRTRRTGSPYLGLSRLCISEDSAFGTLKSDFMPFHYPLFTSCFFSNYECHFTLSHTQTKHQTMRLKIVTWDPVKTNKNKTFFVFQPTGKIRLLLKVLGQKKWKSLFL